MLCALFLLPLFLLAKNFKDCQRWAIKLMECGYSLSLYIFAEGKNVLFVCVFIVLGSRSMAGNGRKVVFIFIELAVHFLFQLDSSFASD